MALLIVIVLISKPNMGIEELELRRETSKVPRLTLGCEEEGQCGKFRQGPRWTLGKASGLGNLTR